MKKIVALVLCVVMVAGLLAGCQKPMDVETLTQKMDEAAKNVNAQSMDVDVDLEMEIGSSGITMALKMGVDATSKSSKEPNLSYMDMKMDMEFMGQKEEISMETYSVLEGDTVVSYAYDSSSEMWTKSEEPDYAATAEKFENMGIKFTELPKEKVTLAEEKELVGERECYVLTTDVDGTHLSEILGVLLDTDVFDMEALGMEAEFLAEALKNADWSVVNLHTVYHVDAETFLPMQYTGEVTGLGEVMNGIFASLMETLGEALPEGVAVEVDVPVLTFTCSNITCEGVEVPTAPQEAIDNAVTEEEMEQLLLEQEFAGGGTYTLSLGGDNVTVVLPAAYSAYYDDPEVVGAATADYSGDVTYMLFSEYTSEDEIVNDLMGEVEWAKQEGLYLSHTEPADYLGYRTMTLTYNDDTASQFFWKKLDGCYLIIDLYTEGAGVDVDEVLNAVVNP